MRVILSTPGTFHHFALARELRNRNSLERVYTTFPWFRVRQESIPRRLVRTFPLVHPAQITAERRLRLSTVAKERMRALNAWTFERYVAATLPPCDFFIAMSGSGLLPGRKAQQAGAVYICDRGSSHMRYQTNILAEEYTRWGCTRETPQYATLAREEAEYLAADYIFVPSEFSFRSFVEMGVPAHKLRKAVLAADVERFYPAGEPNPDQFTVLFVGQISFRKGIPYLLEAFRQLKHSQKKLRLIGAIDHRIRKYLETAPLEEVQFEGSQPIDKIRGAMSEADVTVLPSVEDGFGMVLAEAMACGSPVVSTVNTGGSDLYQDGREGFIVPIRDPKALCQALEKLAGDPSLRQQMRAAALEKMHRLGGWTQYGDTVTSTLLEIQQPAARMAARRLADLEIRGVGRTPDFSERHKAQGTGVG